MSRTKRDILDTETMLQRLTDVLANNHVVGNTNYNTPRADAESLRRISMTLHRWHELECGTDAGAIERDEKGIPRWYSANSPRGAKSGLFNRVPDREKGALARLAAIMARYPSLTSYVQGDPRGCSLFILRPGDVPAGQSPDAYYSHGLAVHQ